MTPTIAAIIAIIIIFITTSPFIALTRSIKGEVVINIIMIAMMAAMVGVMIYTYAQSEKQNTSEIKSSVIKKQNENTAKFIDFLNQRRK